MGGTANNSRQALNMDMNHPDNNVSFSRKSGCYISRLAAFMLFVLFVSSIVATGLLVFYYLPEVKYAVDSVKAFVGASSSNSDDHAHLPLSTTMRILTEDPKTAFPDISSETHDGHVHEEQTISLISPTTMMTPVISSAIPDGEPEAHDKHVISTTMKNLEANIESHSDVNTETPSSSALPKIEKWSRRLPRAISPVHYIVKLIPFYNGSFSIHGNVEVEIDVQEATSNVTLHIADIITHNDTIILRKLDELSEPEVQINKHEFDPQREFYIAHLAIPLEKGSRYMMSMEFEGYLNDNMKGFYRSSYKGEDGAQKFLAATQFQASDARRAFPCFDEPGFKATFEIYLGRQETMNTLSNMPIVDTMPMSDQEGWVWDQYNTTVPMSTYLIAFAVSDFVSMNETYENWEFRVWARESAIEQAEYALQIGSDMLHHFETYFQIPFPLPKLDMIALPDFAPGAMENWGLVTFRETLMLYDPSTSAAHNKQLVAAVTGHELAHQWFGNLVTPQWWTDIWLNEGFASYVEYIGVDHVEPSFQIMEQFVLKRIHNIFNMDSLESSHPIRHDAENADMIAYDKGSSLIRMMNHFLTDATFTKGLNNYLRAFQYANAETDDLWHYLTMAAHEDEILPLDLTVKTIMDTWTLQMGYPVIKVVRSLDGTTATVSQERFLQKKNENSTDDHDYKWWVPLTYADLQNPDFNTTKAKMWMKPSDAVITIESLPNKDDWVIFNIQQTGFYRVNYDDNNWKLIIDQFMNNHTDINTINRAQINDDSINLAKAGQLPYSTPLSLYKYLENEEEYVPWAAALNNMAYLKRMFISTPGYEALKKYLLSIVVPLYNSVGFEDSPDDLHLSQFKREMGLAWACVLGHRDCLRKSVDLYYDWMHHPDNSSIISPNLKSMVYCRAIQEGGETQWNFAWNQYLQSNVGSEKEQLLSAMGCTREQWILSKYLEMAFTTDSGIRKQDIRRVFSAVASNPFGTTLAWNFLRENWTRIYNFLDTIVIALIKASSQNFNGLQQFEELQMFIQEIESQLPEHELELDQLMENVRNNISWMNSYYDIIVQWLQERGY